MSVLCAAVTLLACACHIRNDGRHFHICIGECISRPAALHTREDRGCEILTINVLYPIRHKHGITSRSHTACSQQKLGEDCAGVKRESRAKNSERLHDTTHNYIQQTASEICMASDDILAQLDWTPSQPSGKTDEKWTSEPRSEDR